MRKIIHYDLVDLSQECKVGSVTKTDHCDNYSTRPKIKIHLIIYIEKAFDKIQHRFILKTFNRLGIDGNFLNLRKCIYINPQMMSYLLLKGRKLPSRNRNKKIVFALGTSFQHCTEHFIQGS